MDIRKALQDAIKREKGAYKLYSNLAKRADNINSQKMFVKLALQELKHEALFEEYLRSGDIIEAREKVLGMYDRDMIIDDLHATVEIKSLKDGLGMALKLEHEAVQLYTDYHDKTSDLDLKDIFSELANEEREHERIIRKEYRKYFG